MARLLFVVPLSAVITFVLVYNYSFLTRIGRHAEVGEGAHHGAHLPGSHHHHGGSGLPSAGSAHRHYAHVHHPAFVRDPPKVDFSSSSAEGGGTAVATPAAAAAGGSAGGTAGGEPRKADSLRDHLARITMDDCAPVENTEYWGQVAGWGAGNKHASALGCCQACREQAIKYVDDGTGHRCNAWVWCGEKGRCGDAFQDCWLKRVEDPYHPPVQNEGPGVPWTSGVLTMELPPHPPPAPPPPPRPPIASRPKGEGIHTVVTCNGSPYVNFQMRIHYGTYLAMKEMPGGEHMMHFTRILHRRDPDALMDEVPTVRVEPLHPACDHWCEFPVHDRPNAFSQWLDTKDSEKGEYILLIETDYVWIKPLPFPTNGLPKPYAYHYDYINPFYPGLPRQMKKWYKGPTEDIPCTGPAPILATAEQWRVLTPTWERVTAEIEADVESKKTLGWVREMYAYSLAAAIEGVPHEVQERGKTVLIAQPPADDTPGNASLFHYTWGLQLKVVWEWDKRKYMEPRHAFDVPQLELPPPLEEVMQKGLEQQFPSAKPVKAELVRTIGGMLETMNAASLKLPKLKGCGWSGYPRCPERDEDGK